MSDWEIVTPCSKLTLAGLSPSGKKRQPAFSSRLLILMRAVASFMGHTVAFRVSLVHTGSRAELWIPAFAGMTVGDHIHIERA